MPHSATRPLIAPLEIVSRHETARVPLIARTLLALIVVSLPFQQNLPRIFGVSSSFLLFASALGYIYVVDVKPLLKVAKHPVYVALFGLVAIGSVTEMIHPSASFEDVSRVAQMVLGAIVISTLCRDRQTLVTGLYALVFVGVWLSGILFLTSYGVLKDARVDDFHAASKIRKMALEASALELNANTISSYIGIATAVSLALAMRARTLLQRYFFAGICAFCLIAAFLPVSRGGAIGVIVACAAVGIGAGSRRRLQLLALTIVMGVCLAAFVPDSVWARMTFSTDAKRGSALTQLQDSRAQVYTSFFKHAPEFLLTGVGSGNFWDYWAVSHGFTRGHGAMGAHNCFFQVTVFWGIGGLIVLIVVLMLAKRCMPKVGSEDVVPLAMRAVAVGLLLLMTVSHVLYAKQYSLGLGLLVGGQIWVWGKKRRPAPELTDRPAT